MHVRMYMYVCISLCWWWEYYDNKLFVFIKLRWPRKYSQIGDHDVMNGWQWRHEYLSSLGYGKIRRIPARGTGVCCVSWKLASRGLIEFVCLFFNLSEFFLDVLVGDGFAQSVTGCGLCWCFEFRWVELWGGDGFLLALSVDDSYPDAVFNVNL